MDIPLTPALMLMQAHTPGHQKIQEAVNEITGLLDDFTFNEQETRILQILADFGPEDFIRCLKLISKYTVLEGWRNPKDVSYLQRLYEDMNGEEFLALCHMLKAKLLAIKAASMERLAEIAEKAMNGETMPEVPEKRDFAPTKLTAPGMWDRRTFPCKTEFNADGSIAGKWWEFAGYLDALGTGRDFKMQITDLLLVQHLHAPGKNEIVTLLEVKAMSDKQHRDFLFTNINLVGIVLGAGAFAAAKGLAQRAVIGLFQVAIPAAGQYVTEHEEEIRELKYGRQFLIGWQILNLAMAAYGIYQLFSPAGKSLIGALTKSKDDLLSNNPGSDIAKEAAKRAADVDEELAKVKKHLVDEGVEPSSTLSGGGNSAGTLKNRAPLDPSINVPAITGGKCVASANTELEIIYELKKQPDRVKIDVFKTSSGPTAFLLVERTGNANAGTPSGFSWCPDFNKIIDIFDDLDPAKKKLIDAVESQQVEAEVGIFKKTFGGKVHYVVINGDKGTVSPPLPDRTWQSVGHYHHGADANLAFHYPAPKDLEGVGFGPGGRQVEVIFSRDKFGQIIEIEYGVDLNVPDTPLFVKTLDGKTKWFKDLYPNEIHDTLEQIDQNSNLTEAQKLDEMIKVLKTVDSSTYYAAWWASLF